METTDARKRRLEREAAAYTREPAPHLAEHLTAAEKRWVHHDPAVRGIVAEEVAKALAPFAALADEWERRQRVASSRPSWGEMIRDLRALLPKDAE